MEYEFRNNVLRFLAVFTVLVLLVGTLWAQGGTGELTGLVTDPSGAVVSGAQVTLTNSATGDKRTTVTTGAGTYRFAALPVVGAYAMDIAPKGFKGVHVANIVVTVGTITTHDVKLELGSAQELVEVQAGQQLVQTTDASVSQLIDRRAWESIPIETRSQNELINLVAGAEPEQFNRTGRGASVNGTRSGTGNYLVEGSDNNEQGQGGVAFVGQGGANTTISPDAIQEYRVITNDFPAEYGKAGGFITDTVLKSGTNKWHGSAFEYNRTQAITANDWFSNNATPKIQDHLVRNQFGGSLGGPVIKDKTFFYGTGELHRLRTAFPVTTTGTTQQFLDFVNSGAFEKFQETDPNGVCMFNTGATCPGALSMSSTLGPLFQLERSRQPEAFPVAQGVPCSVEPSNCIGQGFWTAGPTAGTGVIYPVPLYGTVTKAEVQSIDQDRFSFKVDHKLSSKDQLNFVYLFDDAQILDNNLAAASTIGAAEVNPNRAQDAAVTWTRTISNNVLNQARVGYLRRVSNFTAPDAVGIPNIATFVDPLGTSLGATAGIPQFFTDNQFQYKDDVSITHGKHNFKTGFEYRRTRNGSSFFNDRNGTADPWSVEDLVTDLTFTDQLDLAFTGAPLFGSCAFCGASIDPRTGTLPEYYRGYRANEYGAYVQDDWRLSQKLTLNLGVRWEYFGPPHNFKPGLDSNFFFGPTTTPIVTTSTNPFFPVSNPYYARVATGSFQNRHPVWNQDTNNFGPRVGFAYDVRGTGKLVVRGGFGVMYDRIYNNLFENIRFNPPFFADVNFGFFGSGAPAGALALPGFYQVPFVANSNGSLLGTAFKASPRHMDQNLVAPYYEQAHFGIQYEIAKDLVLETNYIGTMGRKLTGILNNNTFDGRTACSTATATCVAAGFPDGFSNKRPNTTISSDNFRTNAFTSNYNALQVSLRKRYAFGLQFNANYTYSKNLDEISDAFRSKEIGTAGVAAAVIDSSNVHLNYGPADFDVRHRVVTSYNYDLPLFKGNRWLGGWQTNGVFSWQTGVPVPVFDLNHDSNHDGVAGPDRPLYASGFNSGNVTLNSSAGIQFLNPTGFTPLRTCPPTVNLGLWCNSPMGRNDVYGPHYVSLDFGFGKTFKITESTKVTFFANFFNIFNHPNFDTPQGNVSDPNFGKSQLTVGNDGFSNGHRIGQLALRFDF